jgi:hypothetical protein
MFHLHNKTTFEIREVHLGKSLWELATLQLLIPRGSTGFPYIYQYRNMFTDSLYPERE